MKLDTSTNEIGAQNTSQSKVSDKPWIIEGPRISNSGEIVISPIEFENAGHQNKPSLFCSDITDRQFSGPSNARRDATQR
jgi:hypothetical protein